MISMRCKRAVLAHARALGERTNRPEHFSYTDAYK